MDLQLKGKCVLVTGGAKGIGAGICTVFAREGADIVMNYRSDEKNAQWFAEKLHKEYGVNVFAAYADMTKKEEIDRMFQQARKVFSSVDVLVNNAACGITMKPFHDYTTTEWKEAQEGILDHVFFASQHFLKGCIENSRKGHIINILSKSAILSSSIYNLSYVANKGALISLTRGMAKEFIQYNVFVNGVVPGYVKTERRHVDGDERTERVKKLLPLKRFAVPEEIGNVTAILASPLFEQMIGTIVDCTGGTLI